MKRDKGEDKEEKKKGREIKKTKEGGPLVTRPWALIFYFLIFYFLNLVYFVFLATSKFHNQGLFH
jgi:hypothetical protein